MAQVLRLRPPHLSLIKDLVMQSPEYFGHTPEESERVYKYIERLVTSEAQSFYGYEDRGRLLSMLGQRFVLTAPTWIENFVFLDKETTKLYNLHTTGFLHVLDVAIREAEATSRQTFLTAFIKAQLDARLKATARALEKYPDHALHKYVPSLWYTEGNFEDCNFLLGLSKAYNQPAVILQWTKPIPF